MLLIKNGYIKTMAGEDIPHGNILIKDGKIVEVGRSISIDQNSDMEVIDAMGQLVMPGIIEPHSHIGITEEKKGMEGDDCNETVEPITPYLRAIDGINTMDAAFHSAIRAGMTSALVGPGSSNVVGGQFAFIKLHGRVIDDMIVKAPAAMKISFGENPKKNYGDNGKLPSTRMTIAAMLREELFHGVNYVKKKDQALQNGEEFENDFRLECWEPVIRGEIPLKAHVHRSDDIRTAIRIANEFGVRMTLDHCTEGHLIADEIAKSGFGAIIGPSLASRNKIEVQNASFKTAGLLNKAGVLVSLTTDHPVTLIHLLPICAGLAAKDGLGIEAAYRALTINAAIICEVDDRVGSLEVGKDADIAIFDRNPMETFCTTLYTIIDGEVVYNYKDDEDM